MVIAAACLLSWKQPLCLFTFLTTKVQKNPDIRKLFCNIFHIFNNIFSRWLIAFYALYIFILNAPKDVASERKKRCPWNGKTLPIEIQNYAHENIKQCRWKKYPMPIVFWDDGGRNLGCRDGGLGLRVSAPQVRTCGHCGHQFHNLLFFLIYIR